MAAQNEIPSLWELPEAESVKEMLRRVRHLEIAARKRSYSLLRGNYATKIRGKGLEFLEARKYVLGESIRQIDWAITARMNEPYVREFQEEREREVFIALDVSPSMHSGWQDLRKIECAVEIAASIACSVIASRDKLGLVSYSDQVIDFMLPKSGEAQLFSVLKTMYQRAVTPASHVDESDLREAVHRIQNMRGKRYMIFFLSDFIDHDFDDDLRYLQKSHDVTMIHIYDPFEYSASKELSLNSMSPERRSKLSTGAQIEQDSLDTMKEYLKKESALYGIPVISISSADEVSSSLAKIFYEGASF